MRLSDFDLWCVADAEELAHTLHTRHHGHFAAAALLDPTGRILHLVVHDEPWTDVHDALAAAEALVAEDSRITEVLLLSAADDLPFADDLAVVGGAAGGGHDAAVVFAVTRRGFADAGVSLTDWVQTDGIDTCSVAELAGHDPWCRRG